MVHLLPSRFWTGALLLLAAVCQGVSAAQLTLKIQPSQVLANPNALPPSTHATITSPDGSISRSSLRKDNTIVFDSIPGIGSHLLSIHTRDYVFASYRIDTTLKVAGTETDREDDSNSIMINFAAQIFPGTQWSDTGHNLIPSQPDASSPSGQAPRPQASLILVPRVLALKQFYEARPAFSPLTLLKNPMVLLGGVALAFTFGIPKLLENMDPEMRQEYEEMQQKGPTAAIGKAMSGQGPASGGASNFDLAGYLAGQKKEGPSEIRGKK